MAVSYRKLWGVLLFMNMSKTELAARSGVSPQTLNRMTKGGTANIATIEQICHALNCQLGDIVEITKEKE